mgnify:CR=1 FL=1
MLAGDGDVRVHDLRPRFSRREIKSRSIHNAVRLLYVYYSYRPIRHPMHLGKWPGLCHLGHVFISYMDFYTGIQHVHPCMYVLVVN